MENNKVVQRIYSKIEEIPTLSPLLQKIVGLIESRKADAHDVTEVISHDPSLTSKVLKVANSAYYGFPKKIDSLDRAVVLLGFNMIRSLAMSIGFIKTFSSGKKSGRFSRERLWIHNLAVATVIKELAMKYGRQEESESLFITGLLHDIGKMVLDQFFTEEYQQALDEAGCLESASVCDAENRFFGMDHGEVGKILLKRWNFPGAICSLVAMDHKTEVPEGVNAADVAMLHIADILTKEAGMGVSESITPSEVRKADLDALGISGNEIDDLRAYLSEAKESIYEFYGTVR